MESFFQPLTDQFGGRNYSASQKLEEISYLAIGLRESANNFCNSFSIFIELGTISSQKFGESSFEVLNTAFVK